jgi:hypothetical protein
METTDKLPKSWCVLNDGSQLFKDTVIKYLNVIGERNYEGNVLDCYYGVDNNGNVEYYLSTHRVFETILTLSEFIELTKPSPPNMEGWAKVGIKSNSDQSLREVENTNKETLQILELHLGSDYYKLAGFTANIANAMDEHSFKVAGRAFVAGRSKSSWGQFIIDENDRIASTPPQPTEKPDFDKVMWSCLNCSKDTSETNWLGCCSNDCMKQWMDKGQPNEALKNIALHLDGVGPNDGWAHFVNAIQKLKSEKESLQSQIEEQKKERDNAVNQYLDQRGLNSNLVLELERVRKERDELLVKINTPEIDDFIEGVKLEAAHQTERWGLEKEENEPPHHYILVGSKLLGKLSVAIFDRDADKFKHHCITLAAVMHNCHRQVVKDGTVINYYFESLKQDNNL